MVIVRIGWRPRPPPLNLVIMVIGMLRLLFLWRMMLDVLVSFWGADLRIDVHGQQLPAFKQTQRVRGRSDRLVILNVEKEPASTQDVFCVDDS